MWPLRDPPVPEPLGPPWQEDPLQATLSPLLTKLPSSPHPNPSVLPLPPSSDLLLESLLLCFLFHTLLLSYQLLSQAVGFLEEERQVTGKEREREGT